jgi:hypothetical protein
MFMALPLVADRRELPQCGWRTDGRKEMNCSPEAWPDVVVSIVVGRFTQEHGVAAFFYRYGAGAAVRLPIGAHYRNRPARPSPDVGVRIAQLLLFVTGNIRPDNKTQQGQK